MEKPYSTALKNLSTYTEDPLTYHGYYQENTYKKTCLSIYRMCLVLVKKSIIIFRTLPIISKKIKKISSPTEHCSSCITLLSLMEDHGYESPHLHGREDF